MSQYCNLDLIRDLNKVANRNDPFHDVMTLNARKRFDADFERIMGKPYKAKATQVERTDTL